MHPSLNEKSSFGVIIERTETHDEKEGALESGFDSPKSSLSRGVSHETLPKSPSRPCPAARSSLLGKLTVDTTVANLGDLEKGLLPPQSATGSTHSPLYGPCRQYSVSSRVQECTMWPSKKTLKRKAKQENQHRRGSAYFGLSKRWGGLTRKQRIAIRLLLFFIVVALGVGVAIGISRAVGGGVWNKNGSVKQIPGSNGSGNN